MNKYDHIIKHETVRTNFADYNRELQRLLDFYETNQQNFHDLMAYYYSDQREQDLKDDQNNLIPTKISRGVLSQDEIYNLYDDYRQLSLRMLELGTNFFKNN